MVNYRRKKEKKQILFWLFKGEGFPSPFPLGDESFRFFNGKQDDARTRQGVHHPLHDLHALSLRSIRNLFEGLDFLASAGKDTDGRSVGFDLAKLEILFHGLIYYIKGNAQILFSLLSLFSHGAIARCSFEHLKRFVLTKEKGSDVHLNTGAIAAQKALWAFPL